MELLHRRCCGLDVHKETVVACLRLVSDGKVTTEVRTFQTTTADLLRLSEWLAANECTHVAMEATGVYWKPVWRILDDGEFALVLANAAHVKNVPGRKTDVTDAMWLAELLAHGLIRASFVPDAQTQEMRNLLRTRKQLVLIQSRAQGRDLAQNHAGAVRLGGGKKEGQLPTGSILPHQSPARPQEGDYGRRRVHPYRDLPHAQGWDDVQGPRQQSLRSPFHRSAEETSGQTFGRPWLRRGAQAARRLSRACGTTKKRSVPTRGVCGNRRVSEFLLSLIELRAAYTPDAARSVSGHPPS